MILLVQAIAWFGNLITTALFIRAIMSWFVRGYSGGTLAKFYDLLVRFTEPIVSPCRDFMSKHFNTGMFDFSIFVAMILVELVTRILIRILLLFV